MKKIRITIFLLAAGWSSARSQTNTFPSTGNVGIGTSSPSHNLHIQGVGGEGVLRLSTDNTSYLTSQTVITGILANSARQWNSNYSATNIEETSAIKFGYYAHVHGQVYNASIRFYTQENGSGSTIERMSIVGENVGIGTDSPKSKLAVNGQIRATEVKVLADISVPDYVFAADYKLRTLKETKEYISENKHLPEIPSATEIGENGIDLGDMNMRLLKKIEELTLYQIELLERLEKVEGELQTLKN
ncbi:MAG: hypothetical protein ABJH72_00330 [Reichenbachiella sp.]|uniref:hypothetical protein n=1 Tax=Reichenbachiella sp. TaxID=2184521 RepID=UPI00326581A0